MGNSQPIIERSSEVTSKNEMKGEQQEQILEKTNSRDTSSDVSNSTDLTDPSVEKRVSVVRFAEPFVTSVRGVADYKDLYSETSLPDVFTIIRMGHEVIRGNLIDVEDYIDTNDLAKALDSYERLCKWSKMYMIMHIGDVSSEGIYGNKKDHPGTPLSTPRCRGLFAVLDEHFENITEEHSMRVELKNLAVTGEQVGSSLKLKKNVKAEFLKLKEMIHNHLGRKEAILMPKIRKMKADEDMNMKQIMKDDILSLIVDSPDFKFFVQHANHHLDKHGQDKPKARMFDHALWHCATGEQWKKWNRWIKGSVRQKTYAEIVAVISF